MLKLLGCLERAAPRLPGRHSEAAGGHGGGGQAPPPPLPGGRHYLSVPGLLRHVGHQEGLLKLLLPDGDGQGGGQPAGQPLLAPFPMHSLPSVFSVPVSQCL